MARKVRRQMNVLNPTQRFQLAKVAETLQEDQFSNWEEAASFSLKGRAEPLAPSLPT